MKKIALLPIVFALLISTAYIAYAGIADSSYIVKNPKTDPSVGLPITSGLASIFTGDLKAMAGWNNTVSPGRPGNIKVLFRKDFPNFMVVDAYGNKIKRRLYISIPWGILNDKNPSTQLSSGAITGRNAFIKLILYKQNAGGGWDPQTLAGGGMIDLSSWYINGVWTPKNPIKLGTYYDYLTSGTYRVDCGIDLNGPYAASTARKYLNATFRGIYLQ